MKYDEEYFFSTAKEIQYYKLEEQKYFEWMFSDFKYRVEIGEVVLTPCETVFQEYIIRALMPPKDVIPRCYSAEAYQLYKVSQSTAQEDSGRTKAKAEGL